MTRYIKLPTVEECASTINWPIDRWPGNCFGIATAFVEHDLVPEGSRAVYGVYAGPVHDESMFARRPYIHHGWVLLRSGLIVDPTRWVFEHVKPYVYQLDPCGCEMFDPDQDNLGMIGLCCGHTVEEHEDSFMGACKFSGDDYDEGGNRWREDNLKPAPKFDPDAKKVELMLMPSTCQLVTHLLELPVTAYEIPVTVTIQQAMWLANLPLQLLDAHAAPLFRALKEANLSGFIPIDNRLTIEHQEAAR